MAKKQSKQEVVNAKIEEIRKRTVETFIKMIEDDGLQWVRQWEKGNLRFDHMNGERGTKYNGMNTMHLAMEAYENGYEDNRWFTFKQAKGMGYAPRKGEHGACVEYWKQIQREQTLKDADGNPMLDDDGNEKKKHWSYWKPVAWFVVFNAEQLEDADGKPMVKQPKPKAKRLNKDMCEIADRLIETSRCPIRERANGGGAWYEPGTDMIKIPNRRKFKTMRAFIATLTHEMTHSTAKPLNRNEGMWGKFGSKPYAFEELVAELGSVFVCQHVRVNRVDALEHDRNYENHAAYLQSWLQVLKKNPDALFKAANEAAKAADYIIERYEGKEGKAKNESAA